MTIVVFVGTLLGGMAIGMPIAFALLVCGVALMLYMNMMDAQIVAQNVINGVDSFPLLAVPFFILAGEIMNAGGLSKRIVSIAVALLGHFRGGLGYVTILAATILSALSGSAVADAAALSAFLVPMMVAAGHDKARAGGLVAASAVVGPIIPPSIAFVFFGVLANVSITKLFLAGIVPGLLLAIGAQRGLVDRRPQRRCEAAAEEIAGGNHARPCRRRLGARVAGDHPPWPQVRHLHAHRSGSCGRRVFALRRYGRLSRAQGRAISTSSSSRQR